METTSYIVGPQWTMGEWFFLIWAAGMTLMVCLMFVWWMAIQFFDPEDFDEPDAAAIAAVDPAKLRDWVEVR